MTESQISSVTSADGSTIAVEVRGSGAPVILVGGAFNDRGSVAGLAEVLAPELTAVTFDRRGRGDSTDAAQGHDPDREIEDIAAVIEYVGGKAGLFGHSSGATLALEAALAGLPVERLALYEPPIWIEGGRPELPTDTLERLEALLAAGDRDGAAALFLTEGVGVPAPGVEQMRSGPAWGYLTGIAHTLPYDVAVSARHRHPQPEVLSRLDVPTLVLTGDQSAPWVQDGGRALAGAIPSARYVSMAGQDHAILQSPDPLTAVLTEFFD